MQSNVNTCLFAFVPLCPTVCALGLSSSSFQGSSPFDCWLRGL